MNKRISKRNKEPINVIMCPIEDREAYIKSLGAVMLDISEKQLGEDGLALVMEELKIKLGK